MDSILIQMVLLIMAGVGWRVVKPLGLKADETRKVLTSVVYYLFFPAMVLEVLWPAHIGWHSLRFTLLGIASISFAMLLMWLIGRLFRFEKARMGAVVLASAFPNVTYLGLPVLEQTFGAWARSVVIQLDLFATSPLLFTAGIAVARHYGQENGIARQPIWSFLNAPPFWAAGLAVALNLNHVATPVWLNGTLKLLSGAVVPLMLFSIGLALSWSSMRLKNVSCLIPVIAIKMVLMPLFAWLLVQHLAIEGQQKAAAVMDLAMPSMLLGIVLSDRYRLDSALYAMAVTVSTALSLAALPFWHHLLTAGS